MICSGCATEVHEREATNDAGSRAQVLTVSRTSSTSTAAVVHLHNQVVQVLSCTGQLNQLENVKTQRLKTLGYRIQNPQGLKAAYDWITQARQEGRFRGPVYGPILLEVQVQDKQHAAYLEGSCPRKLSCAALRLPVMLLEQSNTMSNCHWASGHHLCSGIQVCKRMALNYATCTALLHIPW